MARLDSLNLVKTTLYCGGPAASPARWLKTGLASTKLADSWPQLKDRLVIGTYRGRSAIALACRLLGIGAGHEVLVPAYNCGTELDALLHSGARIVGYPVSTKCEIDLLDLISRKTRNTRAVYLIHYFGWQQPMEKIRQWCDAEGLLLIEDCALALFSPGQSGGIGRTGDAAIFSLPKTLGFRHGGLLSLSQAQCVEVPLLEKSGFTVLLTEIGHAAKTKIFRAMGELGIYDVLLATPRRFRQKRQKSIEGEEHPRMPDSYQFNPEVDAERTLHPRAEAVASSLVWEEIVRARRSNYGRLAAELVGIGRAKILFSHLPTGVCPLSLPLLVANRDRCAEFLQARGIAAYPWWAGFHRGKLDWSEFPDACWLKRNLLTVPIYQGLNEQDFSYLAMTVAQGLRQNEPSH